MSGSLSVRPGPFVPTSSSSQAQQGINDNRSSKGGRTQKLQHLARKKLSLPTSSNSPTSREVSVLTRGSSYSTTTIAGSDESPEKQIGASAASAHVVQPFPSKARKMTSIPALAESQTAAIGEDLPATPVQSPLTEIAEFIAKDKHYKEWTLHSSEDLDQVRKLTIDFAGIKQIPRSISLLKNLKSLELIGNAITDLPNEMADLKNLSYLNLDHNAISEFPPVIARMESLREAHLRANPLPKTLPSGLSARVRLTTNWL